MNIIDDKDLTKNYIGSGINGRCYKIDNNRVYKRFKKANKDYSFIEDLHDFACENKSNIFLFPKELVYSGKDIIGYITDYAGNRNLDFMDQDIKIDYLINEIKRLEREIVRYSCLHLKLFDMHIGNIFISEKTPIKVIDTDEYYFDSSSPGTLLEQNLSQASYPLINGIFDGQLSFKNRKLNYDKNTCFLGGLLVSDYINRVINELESVKEDKIDTVGDLQENIRLILK